MLSPQTNLKNDKSPTSSKNLKDYIHWLENSNESGGLLHSLEAIADNLKKHNNKDAKSTSRSNKKVDVKKEDPTFSSGLIGTKWTLDAFSKTLKDMFGINSTNTAAVQEVLSLPIKHQVTLLGGITERLLGQHAPTNDRNNTFESVMNILGNLGTNYKELDKVVTEPLITSFYNDLPKPFVNYVGHQFRTADGSQNSLIYPEVGKSGSNYTRTVTSKSLNNENLPSPKKIFDRVLKRHDGAFEKHKGGINMFLLYLAVLITHDLFYTDSSNPYRNLTTSYLDLSPLYGFNRADQESVREMKNGLMKPDQWFDKRLVIQPAGVASLLVLFSRNHNYIAQTLLEKNENGRFSYGQGKRLRTVEEQDEELFQTARLVNNGCYANVIIHDYIRTILGTTADSDFVLNPLAMENNPVYGNAVSIEFNAIYRWHSAIGEKDSEWIAEVMTLLTEHMKSNNIKVQNPGQDRALINKSTAETSVFDQLLEGFNEKFVKASPEELAKGLPMAGGHRDVESGKFADVDILRNLRAGFEQSASDIGNGQNTPAALEHVEIAGINQARVLNTCSFNDFRRFLNLTALETFEDFSEKKDVQEGLKELYGTPENVELYTGLMVERSKPTGLCLPYTMGRAILSDAVNLLRNDRILCKELTPASLTNWGYQYTLGDKNAHDRILPSMLTRFLSDIHPTSGVSSFSAEELRTLFNVPSN